MGKAARSSATTVPGGRANAAAGKKSRARRPAVVAPGAEAHLDEAVATEIARNAYARERYEFLLRALFALLGILALSVAGNVYFGLQKTEYRYFATDSQGGIRELVPISRPIQSTEEVLNWATSTVVQSFTMSFANYRQELEGVRPNFTEDGWTGFREALQNHGILDTIINQMYVTTAVPAAAPVLIDQGIWEGRYGWRVELPVLITYQSASGRHSQQMLLEVTVMRRPEREHPKGLGVAQVVAK